MFFRTADECRRWAIQLNLEITKIDSLEFPLLADSKEVRLSLEHPRPASAAVAKRVVSWLGNYQKCMLWVTEYGIWPSSENLHLYYRVRASYGNFLSVGEAPGHEFLSHEVADIVTFLDLAIQFGWGVHIMPNPLWSYAFVSHDEWVHFETKLDRQRFEADLAQSHLRQI